jgi:hypothetical protein
MLHENLSEFRVDGHRLLGVFGLGLVGSTAHPRPSNLELLFFPAEYAASVDKYVIKTGDAEVGNRE